MAFLAQDIFFLHSRHSDKGLVDLQNGEILVNNPHAISGHIQNLGEKEIGGFGLFFRHFPLLQEYIRLPKKIGHGPKHKNSHSGQKQSGLAEQGLVKSGVYLAMFLEIADFPVRRT